MEVFNLFPVIIFIIVLIGTAVSAVNKKAGNNGSGGYNQGQGQRRTQDWQGQNRPNNVPRYAPYSPNTANRIPQQPQQQPKQPMQKVQPLTSTGLKSSVNINEGQSRYVDVDAAPSVSVQGHIKADRYSANVSKEPAHLDFSADNHDEIVKAIVWMEILSKPKGLRH